MNKYFGTTLLITSCVSVSAPYVKLRDTHERIRLSLLSIENWLAICPNIRVVICDGSGYDFSEICRTKFPKAQIECLFFINNKDKVAALGKGFGEGEIIDYALNHSKYIEESDFFVKCTSKLWVNNFKELFKSWNGKFLCYLGINIPTLIKKPTLEWIDTRFFVINKNFYDMNFRKAYERVDDNNSYYIEHVFKDIITEKKISLRDCFFKYHPQVRGISGTTAEAYRDSIFIKKIIRHRLISIALKIFKM